MFYVEVESTVVPVVLISLSVHHHKMCVRVTIVCTRNLLKKETRDFSKNTSVCVLHQYQFCVE